MCFILVSETGFHDVALAGLKLTEIHQLLPPSLLGLKARPTMPSSIYVYTWAHIHTYAYAHTDIQRADCTVERVCPTKHPLFTGLRH